MEEKPEVELLNGSDLSSESSFYEPTDNDKELLAFVVDHTDRWREYRDQNFLDDWNKYERIFRGVWAEEDKVRQSERSRVISPATQQVIEKLTISEDCLHNLGMTGLDSLLSGRRNDARTLGLPSFVFFCPYATEDTLVFVPVVQKVLVSVLAPAVGMIDDEGEKLFVVIRGLVKGGFGRKVRTIQQFNFGFLFHFLISLSLGGTFAFFLSAGHGDLLVSEH